MAKQPTFKSFPSFKNIFSVSEADSVSTFRGYLEVPNDCDALSLVRGDVRVTNPCKITWEMGHKAPKDVIVTTYATPLILSERVVEILRTNRFSGWGTYPVAVYSKRGEFFSGYHGLSVHGRCGPLDWSKGIEVQKEYPAGVFPIYKGVYFEPGSWDESDIFMSVDGSGYIFVVKEVKNVLEQARMRELEFISLEEVERTWDLDE